jgi:type IX secretion system PorP/SprF family membrane protein
MQALSLFAEGIPQYGLYLFGSPVVNPAYTGSKEQWYTRLYYNNHWVRTGTPNYFNVSVDGTITNKINVGLYVVNEQMGLANTTDVVASYAYRLPVGETSNLNFGFSLGVGYNRVSFDEFDPVESNDAALLNIGNNAEPLAAIGVFYDSERLYAGLSLRNIAAGLYKPQSSFLLPNKTRNGVFTLVGFIPIIENLDFSPSMMWQEDMQSSSIIDMTFAFIYKYDYKMGMSFRTEQPLWKPESLTNIQTYALAFSGEIFWRRMTLSYTYTIGLNSFVSGYLNEHEISIGFYITQNVPYRGRIFHFKKHTEYCPVCEFNHGR